MPSETNPPPQLGDVIRSLMRRRGLSGRQLAERAGISATAVSLILGNKFAPRKDTLSRLIWVLVPNEEERAQLLGSYTGKAPGPEGAVDLRPGVVKYDRESTSVSPLIGRSEFDREIWRILSEGGWSPELPALASPYDLAINTTPRIYVVCKASVGISDWCEAFGRALYRQHAVSGSRAIVAVPYRGKHFEQLAEFFGKYGLPVATPDTLVDTIAESTRSSSIDSAPGVDLGNKGNGLEH